MRLPRRIGLAVFVALAGSLAASHAADDPAKPGKLTAEQRETIKKLVAAQPGKLSPEQKQKLKQKLAERMTGKPAKPAKPAAKYTPKPAPPKPPVKPAGELVQLVDHEIDAKLTAAGVAASPAAGDAEFLRRATLDLTGVTPTAADARAFLDSADSDKRAKLIDKLLADPNFGRRQADIWTAKLIPKDSDNRFLSPQPFHEWVAGQFNANTPWDQFTTSLLTVTGSPDDNPAAVFFQANRSADKLTDAVGTHFLGTQLQCAQCHNHPYTGWKQTDYWGLAAFFSKVQARPPLPPKALADRPNAPKPGVTELAARTRTRDFFPESTKDVPPKFLGGDAPKLPAGEPYRPALAQWLTSGESPFFAQAFVNRAWAQMFGRGLVEPMDDLDPEHPATHPEAFAALAAQFRATGYDVKKLYRTLALTAAYQRSSRATAGNDADKELYSHAAVKVLTPEQLFDSFAQVVPMPAPAGRPARPAAAGAYRGNNPRDQFVQFFLAGAATPNAVEYEAGIPQALKLMNSRLLSNPKAAQALAGFNLNQTFENIYLAALARRPTAAEVDRLTAYHAANGGGAAATTDILWAVLNSSEFALVK